ncbi:hypothetical protein Q8F55_008995 [Vanrija albida]|uniref:Uncharacterized protein n=1 Tax=Vanrija albida TaxID=181172 RepID=A0ABR3PSE9_9TREE
MRAAAFLLLALPLAAASPLHARQEDSSSSRSRAKSKSSSEAASSTSDVPTASVTTASATESSAWAKSQPTPSAAGSTRPPELVTTAAVPSRTSGAHAAASAGPLHDPAVIWPGVADWWVINAEKLVVGLNASSGIVPGATPPLIDIHLDNPDTALLNATLRINPGPISVLALPFYYAAEIDLVSRLKPGTGYTITVNGTGLSPQDFAATSQPFEIKPKGSRIITPPGIGSSLYSSTAPRAVPPLTLLLGLLLVVLFHGV